MTVYMHATYLNPEHKGKLEDGKRVKMIFECQNHDDAISVFENLIKTNGMLDIGVSMNAPDFDVTKFIPLWVAKEKRPEWYQSTSAK